MKKKVAVLIRASTLDQAADDRAGVPAQRVAASRILEAHSLERVETIEYSDVSGASVLLTPEIQRLTQLMLSGRIEGVVAREFSRLMRPESLADYALLQTFADTKTILYLPDGPIDFSDKMGRFLGTIRAAMAGLERTEILDRVWAAKEVKRRRGELAQSRIVLGYGVDYEKGRFSYKPEAALVREAAMQFLAGDQNYNKIAKILGVTPRGAHLILRNPIWTGFRVIDKRRDPSIAGKYKGVDGRQVDRRKIARAPEDIIKVQVIEEPLLTLEEFKALQEAMDRKQQNHWRSQPDYEHRFSYNGFLTCTECDEPLQTALARRDYYFCKGRRKCPKCQAKYMARERLESLLDGLFARELTSRPFLEACLDEMHKGFENAKSKDQFNALSSKMNDLRRRRDRILDGFENGLYDTGEAKKRLAEIDESLLHVESELNRNKVDDSLDIERLVDAFSAITEWEFWTREQKRQLLTTLVPDIRVANYKVSSLGLNPRYFSNEDIHTDTGSWRQRA